jgi:murein L,D-transpeptidase YafK
MPNTLQFAILILALAAATVAAWAHWPPDPLPASVKIDRIVVEKSARRLLLYGGAQPVASYRIALGGNPLGHKQREGDKRTPEGLYSINYKKADSAFHRALRVSYPSENDKRHAEELGVNPGGSIMIHGLRNGRGWLGRLHRLQDWTAGCIALTDAEIDQLWDAVEIGTPIEIQE